MARHRRKQVRRFIRRAEYDRLRRAYEELYARYRSLEDDHVALVGDLEEMMAPAPPVRQTGWGAAREAADTFTDPHETQPVPPLAPPDAAELIVTQGLLLDPGGVRGVNDEKTG